MNETYSLPRNLNAFQHELYTHLIEWKWKNITTDAGTFGVKKYNAILPDWIKRDETSPLIYSGIAGELKAHRQKNPFRIHKHFNHMASSQAANINLFLPILNHPEVNSILSVVKPDFSLLATDKLDKGYCIEFWGGNFDNGTGDTTGLLGDKTTQSGTDADIAITYHNHEGELCLWLIEHKLSEKEFTTCGGFRSENRKKENEKGLANYDCEKSFSEILRQKERCYYHDKREYRYWDISQKHEGFFVNHDHFESCPFKGGMNQLWRNQLLALAIEDDIQQPFRKVYFSVVRHPENRSLDKTLEQYEKLIGKNERFFCFTSKDVLTAVDAYADSVLTDWSKWYKSLYNVS